MTDEQIMEAFEYCAKESQNTCTKCPYYTDEHYGCDDLKRDLLDYINRLKAENERLKQSDTSKENCTIEQHAEIHKLRDELKQVRKETAKDILQRLFNFAQSGTKGNSNDFVHACNEMKYKIRVEAKKYGVEVDE